MDTGSPQESPWLEGEPTESGDTQDLEAGSTPLQKPELKVGVILGPGGVRSFAHTGVLRELLQEIPIHSVVGIEWGALIGAMFATHGQVHKVEWELYKLEKNDFFVKKGLFGSKQEPME